MQRENYAEFKKKVAQCVRRSQEEWFEHCINREEALI